MNSQSSGNNIYDTTIRLFILLLIIAWCLLIIYPFANIILWSFILAMAIYPLHSSLSRKMGGRSKLASLIIVLAILAIFIFPVGMLIGTLVDEVKELKQAYDSGNLAIPAPSDKSERVACYRGKSL